MKNLLLIGTFLFNLNAFAKPSMIDSDKGNGGDICENQMRNISNDIESWLLRDEFKGIKLDNRISEAAFKGRMLEAVQRSLLSCTADKIFIGKAEKTCKNFKDKNRDIRIVCNFNRFMKTTQNDQYRLMHHEFAGVAGLETNDGKEESNYRISDQVTGFLRKEEVLRLGIKKATGSSLAEKIGACGNVVASNSYVSSTFNECKQSNVSVEIVKACGNAVKPSNLIGSTFISCLNSGANVDVIDACGRFAADTHATGSSFVSCLL